MVKRALLILVMLSGWPGPAAAAQFTASVDRAQANANGYVILTLKLINSDTRLRARGVEPNVDLTLLSGDFKIGVPKTRNRFNLYQGQGRSTSELEVELFPKHQGTLTIPPFTVDKLSTKPIQVLVLPPVDNPTPDVFIKSGVTHAEVWQHQQTIAYLDLYYRVDLKDARLGEHVDTDPQDIDLDKLPQGERKESIGPFTYKVQRIGWALMPIHSGKLVVTLPELWAQTVDGKKFHSNQQKQTITVKALPPSVPPLTLVGRPEITTDLKLHQATVDKLFSWTITVKAATALNDLPDTLSMDKLPDQFKFYYDRPDLRKDVRAGGMTAVATYAVSAIPLQPGKFRIPGVEIPYFDPHRGILRSVTQPAVPISVGAAKAPAEAPPPETLAPASPPAAAPATPRVWQAATAMFAALWLVTTVLLWRRGRTPAPLRKRRVTPVPRLPDQPYKTRLLEAFGSATLEEGLNAFERIHGIDAALRDTVRAIQRLYYSPAKERGNNVLEQQVNEAVQRVREAGPGAGVKGPADPWSPHAFTPSWRVTKATSSH